MQGNKQGILSKIIEIDKTLNASKYSFIEDKESEYCRRLVVSASIDTLEDYKALKDSVTDLSFITAQKVPAYQTVKIRIK